MTGKNKAPGFAGGSMLKNWPANEETRVQSLGLEDLTCHWASKPCTTTAKPVLQSPGAEPPEARLL